MLELVLFLAVALPLVWFLSEFQERRWIRIASGCSAIAMSIFVAYGVGSLEELRANAWYGDASKNLVDSTIEELENGDTEKVIEGLKILQEKFEPTYENRARYDELIKEYLKSLGQEWNEAV